MLPVDEFGALSERFLRFADEARGRSPLYETLSRAAAETEAAAEILAVARDERQRRPNLLFAAIHDRLLAGVDHPLAEHYPSVGGTRAPTDAPAAFVDFLVIHRTAVEALVASRRTQTNEVGRCAGLWPALGWIMERSRGPVALIELGASAGLLLHVDRYTYAFDGASGGTPGSRDPTVAVTPRVTVPPPAPAAAPKILRRTGIDLEPLDPSSEADARWLAACVWPDQLPRLEQLRRALELAARYGDVDMVRGDFVDALPDALDDVSDDVLPVVVHSAAAAYLNEGTRRRLEELLDAAGARRDLARVAIEGTFFEPFPTTSDARDDGLSGEYFHVGVTTWIRGTRSDTLLARMHPHGEWLEWLSR